jgi:hypothetical protein
VSARIFAYSDPVGCASFAIVCAVILAPPVRAGQATLSDVLDRFASYVDAFERQMTSVVAEEDYRQTLTVAPVAGRRTTSPVATTRTTRALRSDYALMRAPGDGDWVAFRDTFEVDGQPVRDHDNRLQQLLASGAVAAAAQVVRESARYNLGSDYIVRNVNVPTLVLHLLHPRNRARFSFKKVAEEQIGDGPAWRIEYRERERPTIVRSPEGRDRPSHGSIWVNPVTGAVVRTAIVFDRAASMIVTFGYVPGIAAIVPLAMSEQYNAGDATISGEATYSNYRRFQTGARVIAP